ncbi:TadE/TadG family type IV pilus assembly protein [Fontimonas sp. SYSU GA230001]|uniref:TadE/TadG family type IV pilus assembly protein n=1 Tax=Fontimonas sp. SYSU GA230001 TaxID=3142450 RepID=UPI0032B3F8ED
MRRRQRGLTTVEFAFAGVVVLVLLFAVIEIGRAMFVWNTLGEATRRAARLAAVCPPGHASVLRAALLNNPDGSSTSNHIRGLTTANVSVEYLNGAGAATAVIGNMAFVRVSITGFTHTLLIPFLTQTLTVPPFRTTVPTESLGYVPETGTRTCPGG